MFAIVMIPTTKLISVKGRTPALTAHYRPVISMWAPVLKGLRTRVQQVSLTPHHGANAFALVWGNGHGQVEAVN